MADEIFDGPVESIPRFDHDLLLILIGKELRYAKFTSELDKVGFESSCLDMDLGLIILSLTGFSTRTDELWSWYYQTLDKWVDRIDLLDLSTSEDVSLGLYLELCTKLKMHKGLEN